MNTVVTTVSSASRYGGSPLTQLPRQYSTRTAAGGQRVSSHDASHGFCTVCGAVWPCARARRDALAEGGASGSDAEA